MSLRLQVVIGAASALVIGLIAWWWFATYERVATEIPKARTGEARYNPFFALKKTLQARGITVESRANLTLDTARLKPGDVLVLSADPRTVSDDQAEALYRWVERGGHLIFSLPSSIEGKQGPLLDAFEISRVVGGECVKIALGDGKRTRNYCARMRFQLGEDVAEEDFDWLWGSPDHGYVMGRRTLGEGDWFVASHLRPLTTAQLKRAGNAELAWQILGPVLGQGKVYLIYQSDMAPLHVLIAREGWPILLPLVLALIAWLWSRAPRFGPLLPLAAPHRRALFEHVHAAGEFTFWRGHALALHAAMRRAYFERLRLREPRIAALEGELLITTLAERYQRDPAEIKQALDPVDLAKPDRFVATIRTLMELKAKP